MLDKKTIIEFIPDFWLHDIMMGCGSIWIKNKEIIVAVKCHENRLSCGCPGSKFVRVRNKDGAKVLEDNISIDTQEYKYIVNNLQGKEWEDHWENYYKKHPWQKPINISEIRNKLF